MSRDDYKKADTLYTAALAANPKDARVRMLDIDALLGENKLADANQKLNAWIAEDAKAPYAILAAADIRFVEGDWVESYVLDLKALAIDPCLAAGYEGLSNYEYRAGFRATAARHIALAHQLAPNDQDIRLEWIDSLGEQAGLDEARKYLADSQSIDDKKRKATIARFDRIAARSEDRCSFVSAKGPVRIPLVPLYDSVVGVRAYGIEVAFNGKKRVLQIDTGASGLTLTQSQGASLGLPKLDQTKLGGFGSEGASGAVTALSASVHIGGMEFKNCTVDILSKTGLLGGGTQIGERLDTIDGLIGTDVFNHYLVTLDYMRHEIRLDPLPQDPAHPVPAAQLDSLGGSTNLDWLMVDRYIAPSMQNWTKIYREGHTLIVPARLNSPKLAGDNGLFVADTGSESNLIDVNVAKKLTKAEQNDLVSFGGLSGNINKVFETGKFTIDFGGLRLPVSSMDSVDLSNFTGVSGFLGYPTLEQLVMHIDYRDNLMLFEAPNGKKM